MVHDLGDPADSRGDDGLAVDQRLDDHYPEGFRPGREHEDLAASQSGVDLLEIEEAGEVHEVADSEPLRERLELASERAIADQRQAQLGPAPP